MSYLLGDVYIKSDGGSFPITQDFGADYQTYHARYNLQGHNGLDFGVPSMTPLVSAADGWISEIGQGPTFDKAGYGNYLKIVHNGYLTLYAHLNDLTVKLNDRVVRGQLIGHSNNSGFSTAPHLHFGVAPCDGSGNKTETQNGFSGYIDPDGARCEWEIHSLTAPIMPGSTKPPVQVPFDDYPRIIAEGTNGKVILTYLIQSGMNEFLGKTGKAPVDLQHNIGDPEDGNKAVSYLEYMFDRPLITTTEQQAISEAVSNLPTEQRSFFLSGVVGLLQNIGVLRR